MPLNVETQAGDEAPLRQKEIISLAAKTRVSIHVYLVINQVSRQSQSSQTTQKWFHVSRELDVLPRVVRFLLMLAKFFTNYKGIIKREQI